MLTLSHICKTYLVGDEPVHALVDVSLDVQEGEFVAICGPSGSGKTTLMNVMGCLDLPDSGSYLLDGIDVAACTDSALSTIRSRKIGFIFQQFNLLDQMSALENVELPLIYQKLPQRERLERAREALSLVGLEKRMRHRPSQLSGGQQQRVAIARALAKEPQLLLLDEPLSNLDAKLRVEMREEILRIQRASQVTTVFVTHDQEEASSIADEVILLKLGVLQQQDSARRLYDEPVNFFAADFLGAPPINKLRGSMEGGRFRFAQSDLTVTLPLRREVADGTAAILAVRAESVVVPAEERLLPARVVERYSINKDELSVLEIAGQQCRGFIPGEVPLALGQQIEIGLKRRGVFLFDAETGERLA